MLESIKKHRTIYQKMFVRRFSSTTHFKSYSPPARLFEGDSKRILQTIDCHCAGLPARVVVGGMDTINGARSAAELRETVMSRHDDVRKLVLQEPRGYPCQNVDIVFPPTPNVPDAAYSFVIGENNFVYPLSSGHNTICVVTALLESGMVPMEEPETKFTLEAPAMWPDATQTVK